MKKQLDRKLTLSRESLRLLEERTLRRIEGAASNGECTGALTHCLVCPA